MQSKTWLVRSYGLFSSFSTSDSHSSAPRLWLRSLSLSQISISISLSNFFFQWIILQGLYILYNVIVRWLFYFLFLQFDPLLLLLLLFLFWNCERVRVFFFLFSLSLSLSFLCSVWLARKCGNGKHEKTTVSDRGEFFSRKLDWVIWTVCLVAGYGIERIVQICVWFFSTFRHFLGNQTRCLYASEMNF